MFGMTLLPHVGVLFFLVNFANFKLYLGGKIANKILCFF